jgi:glutamate dehydrogenase
VAARHQTELLLESRKLIERTIRWLLISQPDSMDISALINRYSHGVTTLSEVLPSLSGIGVQSHNDAWLADLAHAGVPDDLIRQVACFEALSVALDVVEISDRANVSVEISAAVYFQLGKALNLHWIRDHINELPRSDRWQTLARAALREDLNLQERQLTLAVIGHVGAASDAQSGILQWLERYAAQANRCRSFIEALMNEAHIDVAMLSAALRELRGLTQAADAGNDTGHPSVSDAHHA